MKQATKQAKLDEKAAAKQAKLDEKAAAKQSAKQAKLDEKAAAKQAKLDSIESTNDRNDFIATVVDNLSSTEVF